MNIVENYAREFWRYSSVQLTGLWSILVGWLMLDPANMAAFVGAFPDKIEPAVGPILGFLIFATIGGARGVTQKKLAK